MKNKLKTLKGSEYSQVPHFLKILVKGNDKYPEHYMTVNFNDYLEAPPATQKLIREQYPHLFVKVRRG